MNPDEKLENVLRTTPKQKIGLSNLGLITLRDLVYHFPYRYENPADLIKISEIKPGEKVRVWGRVKKIDYEKTWKKKLNIAYATVEDATDRLKLVWFRQPYVARMLPEGTCAIFSGKASIRKEEIYIANPLYDLVPCGSIPDFSGDASSAHLQSLYPATAGVSSLWIQKAISKVLPKIKLEEFLPREILDKYHLPELNSSIRIMHSPKEASHAEAARKRFAFEEVFLIQLLGMLQKKEIKSHPAIRLQNLETLKNEFISLLSFKPTNAQLKAIDDVIRDLNSGEPMNRLLEGDVGSGKTAVAACAAFIAAKNGLQAAYMAPTEILARQHFESFYRLLGPSRIKIGLLTSSISEKFPSKVNPQKATHVSKNQLLKWVKEGEFPILIGTHSLIEKAIQFKNLAIAMVDEQHRFGVKQRARFAAKNTIPHFLTMTATPIPRTLALSIYADLDVSIIDELPPGRQKIETKIVPPKERTITYEFMREKLKNGEQAFVICPRIQPNENTPDGFIQADMKSVKDEYKKLNEKVFPEFNIGLMHGKLTPKEKETTMQDFRDGKTSILVSTSVVEVGVDVPNATIMFVEGAERFGLAQLHQFRGRVGRGDKKSYCFVLPSQYSATVFKRLKALTEAKSGFELAEYDLEFRGAGELTGKHQSGLSDIAMEAIRNIKMVEAARNEARNIIENDLLVKHSVIDIYENLNKKIAVLKKEPLHFE